MTISASFSRMSRALVTASVSMPTAMCSPWYSRTPSGSTTGVLAAIAARIWPGSIIS